MNPDPIRPAETDIEYVFRRHFEGGVTPAMPGAKTWVYLPEESRRLPRRRDLLLVLVALVVIAAVYLTGTGR